MASVTDATPVRRVSVLQSDNKGLDSTDSGPSSSTTVDTTLCAPRTDMVTAFNPLDGIQGLTQLQVKALMLQIGYSLTTANYNAIDSYNRIGKYLLNSASLVNKLYIKEDYFETYGNQGQNAALHLPMAWTGKNSIASLTDFFAATQIQESIMYQLLAEYYDDLVRNNGVKSNDLPGTVMGMLFVAHMSSTSEAQQWRAKGTGVDVSGAKLGTYYGLGRYAGTVLSSPTGIL